MSIWEHSNKRTFIFHLYKICYFETDKDNSLLEVKIRKILSYSNAIASGSNLIQTALSQDINNLDIGGLIVTINRIVTDKKFIEQIKDEFIFGEYKKTLLSET